MTQALLDARIGYFVRKGLTAKVPTPWQVRVGWMAMLPITLSESERERVRSRSTLMGQVPIRVPLQLLYHPAQGLADTGLTRDASHVVRHLLSVFHEDAFLGYDLQLLESMPGGLALLAREAQRVVDGTTRWAPYLRRLVGWPSYHADLVRLAEAAQQGEYPDPLDLDPRFATLTGFASFCASLPDWPELSFYGFSKESSDVRD